MPSFNTEPRLVIFEGLDRSGKTSLRKEFAARTRERVLTADRMIVSSDVYDEFFKRPQPKEVVDFRKLTETILKAIDVVIVLVDTEPKVCLERGAEYLLEELKIQRSMFFKQLSKQPHRIIVLKTKNKSISECADELIEMGL